MAAATSVTSSGAIAVQQGVVNVSLGGAGALTKTGSNTFTLNAPNLYTGGTNVNAGTLVAAVSGAIPLGPLTVGGGILDIGSTNHSITTASFSNGTVVGTGIITAGTGATVDFPGSQTFVENAVIAGTNLIVTKSNGGNTAVTAGTALLNANNTYTGTTTIGPGGSTGTLNNAEAIIVNTLAPGGSPSGIGQSSSAAGNLVLNQGMLIYAGSGATTDRNFTLGIGGNPAYGEIASSGTGPLTFSFTGAIVANNGTLDLGGTFVGNSTTGSNTFLPDIPGSSTTLIKDGGSLWSLPGVKNYGGPTRIIGGTLLVDTLADGGAASGIGTSSNDPNNLQFNGGTLRYVGNGANIDRGFVVIGGNGASIDSSGPNTGSLVFRSNAQVNNGTFAISSITVLSP